MSRRPEPHRPLELDPARVMRADRPHYGIIDIGSNSVRLLVYDQLGRAPLPRFNEKSLARLAEGLAETGAIHPEGFRRTLEAARRFRAIAEAMGVGRLDVTATEAIRRASNGRDLADAIAAEAGVTVRILSGAEEARYAALGVISGFFRPVGAVGDMGGGSLEIAEAIDDHVGDAWVSLPLGALPVEALLAQGYDVAKKRVDDILRAGVKASFARPVFYPVGGGWRAVAKAHIEATAAPVKTVHGYAVETSVIRAFAKSITRLPAARLAAMPGVSARRARTLPAAALVLDRALKRLAPQTVIFSALGLREGLLYSQLDEAERYRDPLVEGAQLIGLPFARVPDFAPALAGWTAGLFPNETPAETRLRVAACALSDIAWRDAADLRAEESFRRLLQFPFIGVDHAERVFLAAVLHARYGGKADASWLAPAIGLLSPALQRRAQILGRAMQLAYRFSGVVPAVLASAGLRIDPDCVRLDVSPAARAPDSEVVVDRLRWLAQAVGAKRTEIVVREDARPA
ncbi:exopolyphosphatase/guanosine-5'-triphosphate,3'-diphosphate pyrophosphatase [Roseiarcus fermentans]|uniref:Exopolyphosphatase/guanosine-5'-triphosphate, 3'-diphosphate pyrophosphatase n=1 Tax=Roseiarcus fermentans TaxID=1473586 RepID=A0A366FTT6_9HYPH|nr:Ppx/GppA phosphatase family protein [Roseiarcus fermentans]RBP17566.1 exopolyphosphatase/guanosine-5'-triphosphate,3'-diphosphate pyrophosphatase [Roseiarcus fermentans]